MKCAGSSVKESVRAMVSRLCTNNVMSFLSISGTNLGKMAFSDNSFHDKDQSFCHCLLKIRRSREAKGNAKTFVEDIQAKIVASI